LCIISTAVIHVANTAPDIPAVSAKSAIQRTKFNLHPYTVKQYAMISRLIT